MSQSTQPLIHITFTVIDHLLEATIELNNCEYPWSFGHRVVENQNPAIDLQSKHETHLLSWVEETEGVQHALLWKVTCKCTS